MSLDPLNFSSPPGWSLDVEDLESRVANRPGFPGILPEFGTGVPAKPRNLDPATRGARGKVN